MKRVLLAIIGSVVIGYGLFVVSTTPQPAVVIPVDTAVIAPAAPIALVFVGDIMMDRGVERSVLNTMEGDYNALFADTPYLQTADIAFANLEGPVAVGGHNVGSIYSFRMDPDVLGAVKNAGIDIVSFANNHVGDYTREAFDETLLHLQENNIAYVGAGDTVTDASTVRIVEVRGTKVGYLAATDVGPVWLKATDTDSGILLANNPNLPDIIAVAKAKVDVLVMSFHFGDEYSPASDHQKALAHAAIDSGADIVVGHHPHVMEMMETYNGKPIFYSLGNFIFDQYFSVHTMRGMVATVLVDPQTKELTTSLAVSPLSKQFVPQPLVPFSTDLLVQKTFTP